MSKPEEMSEFFKARAEDYDRHMMECVEGCREGYVKMAQLLPESTQVLLDLGCGTGLELDEILRRFPDLSVTGIDLTPAMLERLAKKHPNRRLRLICGDYFQTDLGEGVYDAAVSFETLHHFPGEQKLALYKRVFRALREGGSYIECDYMVEEQAEEDHLFDKARRLRLENGISQTALYHIDTPMTVANQLRLLRSAGFRTVESVFRMGGTSILVAQKGETV